MINGPLISIVVPTFNSATTLGQCIGSIAGQTFTNLEVVFVDGGSTDESLAIIKKYAVIHPGTRWISEKDNGVYDAMNKGIDLAKGEWIYFLGSDDRLYEADSLKIMAASIQDSDADMIYGNVIVAGDSFWARDQQLYDGEFSIDKLLVANICHQAIFYKRAKVLKLGGFNTRYPVCADWDLNFKFYAAGKCEYTNQVIAFFAAAGKSSQKITDAFYDKDIVINLQSYFGWSLFNRHFRLWKNLLLKHARIFFKSGHLLKGLFYYAAYRYHSQGPSVKA